MQRGEIWWAELNPPAGRRPVLLLSRNSVYLSREKLTIAPLTRTIRVLRSHVPVGPEDGLRSPSVVNLDDITTIPKSAIADRIAILSETKMVQVDQAIKFALDLPD